MRYYEYNGVVSDPAVAFTSAGLRALEEQQLRRAFGASSVPLTPADEEWLKAMTGCQTFLEFRERVFSPHRLVDHEMSVLLIERVRRGPPRQQLLEFKALLMNGAGEWVTLVRRRLNRGEGVVDHNLLHVRPEFEGRGLGSVISQSHEDAWRAAGYRSVALTAAALSSSTEQFGEKRVPYAPRITSLDGRVYWAWQGYDFHPDRGVSAQQTIRQAIVAELSRMAVAGLMKADYAVFLESRAKVLPAYDLVFLEGLPDDKLGEKVFASHDWQGYKALNEEWPGHEAERDIREKHLRAHPFPRVVVSE